eukprot:SAG31_NODE_19627_length_596_cov_1.120724_1_plen_74_part_01
MVEIGQKLQVSDADTRQMVGGRGGDGGHAAPAAAAKPESTPEQLPSRHHAGTRSARRALSLSQNSHVDRSHLRV